jgi:hypothetical protein
MGRGQAVDLMRQIRQFRTDDKGLLSTQLSQLENNVAQELALVESEALAVPVVTATVTPNTAGGVFSVGDCLMADTTLGGFSVNLAAPVDGLPGWFLAINRSGNTLKIQTVPPALLNLSSVAQNFAGGLHQLFFDGHDYWGS